MTATILPHLATPRSIPSGFLSAVATLFAGITEGRAIAQRYDFLVSLSEAELEGFGLTRHDIPHAAATGF